MAQGKNITLRGTVIDAEGGRPLEYATIVVESASDPNVISGAITDTEGNFEIKVARGEYRVKVEYISYSTIELAPRDFTSNTNLGTIEMRLDVEQLEAVEVVGEKTSVEVRLDKKVYNVGKDLTNSGATISDALDNIPSVSVDVDGAIA